MIDKIIEKKRDGLAYMIYLLYMILFFFFVNYYYFDNLYIKN